MIRELFVEASASLKSALFPLNESVTVEQISARIKCIVADYPLPLPELLFLISAFGMGGVKLNLDLRLTLNLENY